MRLASRALALLAALASGPVCCEGCRPGKTPDATDPGPPTVRLYVVSDVAGALEPCGCVKDQLGGLDHAAAFIGKERARAEGALLVAAGPTFFMDPLLKPERAAQERAKAEAIAKILGQLGFAAAAPGRNDWAAGAEELAALGAASGGALVAANLAAPAPVPWVSSAVREVRGTKVGLVGVSAPDRAEVGLLEGVTVASPTDAVRQEVAKLRAGGAVIVVALAALGRGEAKRLADEVPELTAVVVGSPGASGDANTDAPPAERAGDVIVVETGNHLQTLGVLDFWVRDGSAKFADASGLDRAQRRASLVRQMDELRGRLAMAEGPGKKPDPKELEDARKRLAKLEAEEKALGDLPPPKSGSFFRYSSVEVRESLGKDEATAKELAAYFDRVNEMNRAAFAGKLPRPPADDGDAYAGVAACTTCHDKPRAVWDKTPHARAYGTLAAQHKQFNLDCVSCHVTGYDEPGGSTVVHVGKLEGVQCEACHGPSARHAKSPKTPVPTPVPAPERCLSCHHPPHVHEFDAAAKLADVLGPGHGKH